MFAKRKTQNANAKGGKPAFMPYVCCGDPSPEFTIKLVEALVANGADAVEFGIPFSDPIADGKTIQDASSRALANGMTPKKAMEVIMQLRKKGISAPIIAMTYYNIIFANGVVNFLRQLKEAGADAIIVPDIPLEESKGLRKECVKIGIDLVYLISPNCTNERIEKIAEKSRGFIYAVSVLGITGAREKVAEEALELVKRAKKITALPLAVGFGISKPEHVKTFADAGVDGIIVGSEIVNIYARYIKNGRISTQNEKKALEETGAFSKAMSNRL